jgi:cysteine-rich repeat protein
MRYSKTFVLAIVSAATAACVESVDSSGNAIEGTCEEWGVTEPKMIWPPDHEMHRFTLDDCVTTTPVECPQTGPVCGNGVVEEAEQCDDGNTNPFDGCDTCVIVDTTPDKRDPGSAAKLTTYSASTAGLQITSITSNEADNGSGDGTTTDDAAIIDAVTFELRAERGGGLDGRQYRVSFVDATGATGTCTFFVPSSTTR